MYNVPRGNTTGARDDFPTWLMAKRLVAAEMIKEAEFEAAWQDEEDE